MQVTFHSVQDLGLAIRAVRKGARLRQDDLAALAGVSKQFATDVERGKPTAQIGLVLHLLAQVGIVLQADLPEAAAEELERLRQLRDAAAPN